MKYNKEELIEDNKTMKFHYNGEFDMSGIQTYLRFSLLMGVISLFVLFVAMFFNSFYISFFWGFTFFISLFVSTGVRDFAIDDLKIRNKTETSNEALLISIFLGGFLSLFINGVFYYFIPDLAVYFYLVFNVLLLFALFFYRKNIFLKHLKILKGYKKTNKINNNKLNVKSIYEKYQIDTLEGNEKLRYFIEKFNKNNKNMDVCYLEKYRKEELSKFLIKNKADSIDEYKIKEYDKIKNKEVVTVDLDIENC